VRLVLAAGKAKHICQTSVHAGSSPTPQARAQITGRAAHRAGVVAPHGFGCIHAQCELLLVCLARCAGEERTSSCACVQGRQSDEDNLQMVGHQRPFTRPATACNFPLQPCAPCVHSAPWPTRAARTCLGVPLHVHVHQVLHVEAGLTVGVLCTHAQTAGGQVKVLAAPGKSRAARSRQQAACFPKH